MIGKWLQHILSRLAGKLAFCRIKWIKNTCIDWFIARYGVDMRQASEPSPHRYPHFNAFFTRALRHDARPIAQDDHAIISPADGKISQMGSVTHGHLLQAKGMTFSLMALLGGEHGLSLTFQSASFATIYLSPADYHRVHSPLSCRLTQTIYVPGRLFSVNDRSSAKVPRLFARNERVIALFETPLGKIAVIFVGALIVASIETVWAGLVAPHRSRVIQKWDHTEKNITFEKGQELGRFRLGSTVIVLSQKPINWHAHIKPGSTVCMGQGLGTLPN